MKKIVALPANPPRSTAGRNIAWVYAAVLTLMAVGQLFSFEKFIPLIKDYELFSNPDSAMITASVIVICEVFALPFLLRMPLSPMMRIVSFVCSLLAAGIWMWLALVSASSIGMQENGMGMFGVKLAVPAGGVAILLSLAIGILAIWSAVGLLPAPKK